MEIFNEVCELQNLKSSRIDIEFVKNIESIHKLYDLKELKLTGEGDGVELSKEKRNWANQNYRKTNSNDRKLQNYKEILHNRRSSIELTSLTANYKNDNEQISGNYYIRLAFITLRYSNLKNLSLSISDGRPKIFSFAEKTLVLLNDLTELESLELVDQDSMVQKLLSLRLTQDCSDSRGLPDVYADRESS